MLISKTLVSGPIGSEDNLNNWHWENSTTIGSFMNAEIFQFTAHEAYAEQHELYNKVSHYDGTEFDTHMASATTTANNNPLVPTTPPPHPPYPDCYDHTLAHWPDPLPEPNVPFLTELDLVPGTPATWIGQGTMVGYGHTMRGLEADGGGLPELVFGNFDGHIHVMERSGDELIDEWRSDFLGHSLYAVADTDGGLPMYFANGAGQIYKFHHPGSYQVDLLNPSGTPELYDAQTHRVYLGDFDAIAGGDELLVLNHFNDWVLLDSANGSELGNRWWRRNRIHGPGHGQVVEDVPFMDPTDGDDLLMPAYDGSVWRIWYDDGSLEVDTEPVPGLDFLHRALYLLETFEVGGIPYAFVFGNSDAAGSRVTLLDLQTGTVEFDDSISSNVGPGMTFAWIRRPTAVTDGEFVISKGSQVHKYSIDVTGCSGSGTFDFDFLQLDQQNQQTATLSLALLDSGHLAVGTGGGRIFLLDPATLTPTRTTLDIDPSGNAADYWHANHTLARAAAADAGLAPAANTATLYVGDYFKRWNQSNSSGAFFRLTEMSVDLGATPAMLFSEVKELIHHVADSHKEAFRTRTLYYRDLDNSGQPEPYPLAESGVAYVDSNADVRQFSNVTHDPDLLPEFLIPIPFVRGGPGELGGFVFEQLDPTGTSIGGGQQASVVLDDFYAPRDPLGRYAEHPNPNKKLWWRKLAKNEANTWGGQIATGFQSTWGYYEASSSMTTAMIRPPGGSTPELHIVTGTIGGYVFAIVPPANQPAVADISVDASLSYFSDDLGWYAVGLDAGDLDGDADEEIVVGVWVDDGSFDDWVAGGVTADSNNRGKLYILDPQPGAGSGTQFFATTELTGWDGIDPATGLSSGVFGVKVDDVNDDGQAEIWAGDANGALHLFEFVGGQWTRIYQSEDLAPYAGWWNGIFPIKDGAGGTGQTVGLILRTTGYWMGFHVDPSQIWP